MRNVIALVLLFALGVVALIALDGAAQAKLAPVEPQPAAILPADLAISTGAAGLAFEPDYFRAPPSADAAGGAFLCRPQLRVFDKTRIAQSCH